VAIASNKALGQREEKSKHMATIEQTSQAGEGVAWGTRIPWSRNWNPKGKTEVWSVPAGSLLHVTGIRSGAGKGCAAGCAGKGASILLVFLAPGRPPLPMSDVKLEVARKHAISGKTLKGGPLVGCEASKPVKGWKKDTVNRSKNIQKEGPGDLSWFQKEQPGYVKEKRRELPRGKKKDGYLGQGIQYTTG